MDEPGDAPAKDSEYETRGALVHSTVKFLRALDSSRHRAAVGMGVSASQLRVLSRLTDSKLLTPSQLADDMMMTSGALTAICDQLVASGLVERTTNPRDRRSLLLSLSATGKAQMDASFRGFGENLSRATASYSPAEREMLSSMMIAMADALENDSGSEPESSRTASVL